MRWSYGCPAGGQPMSNSIAWWNFVQSPDRDGQFDDSTTDGAGATRWGWTWPAYQDARRYLGHPAVQSAFLSLTQAQAQALAITYFWPVKGGLLLASGADIVVVDWEWTSGGAIEEI